MPHHHSTADAPQRRCHPRSAAVDTDSAVRGDLAELELLFARVLEWLPRLWDCERGGFYYAVSSTTRQEFEADIESTAFAINIVDAGGLLDTLPAALRSRVIGYLQERQDPHSGYFVDRQNEMADFERLRGRALNMATTTLARLGAEPLHPLPEISGRSRYTRHIRSVAAFQAWLAERPWSNSWLAQDNIQSQVALLQLLPVDRREALVDAALHSVRTRQDPATGFAGQGVPYNQLSGAFKFALFCRQLGRPVPLAEEIYDAAFEVIRSEECIDACWLRNPVELIEVVGAQLGGVPADDVAELVRISTHNAYRFAQDDGGFCRHVGHSKAAPNEVRLGCGLAEGDLNATHQFVTTVRPALHRLAGLEPPQLPAPADWSDRFTKSPTGS